MKSSFTLALGLCLALCSLATAATPAAQSSSWSDNLSVNMSVGFESEYFSHGWDLAHDVVISTVGADYKLYQGTLYAQLLDKNIVGQEDAGLKASIGNNITELAVGYKLPVYDKVTADVGYFQYFFTDNAFMPTWREIYGGLTYNGLYVNPSLYLWYDFDRSATFVELSGGHSYSLAKYGLDKTSLKVGGLIGGFTGDNVWTDSGNDFLGISKKSLGYMYYDVTADLVYSLNKNTSASVGVRYGGGTAGINGGASGDSLIDRKNDLWWGTKFAYKF
jgi:hypothetical protein